MDDRPDTRPEIEPCFWDIADLKWPIKGKTKPDLIIFDPPYFKKQSNNYDPDGISGMSKEKYLKFLKNVLDTEEDVQLQIEATNAMENTGEPGISMLIKLMKSKSEYKNYQIIIRHVLDGRIY